MGEIKKNPNFKVEVLGLAVPQAGADRYEVKLDLTV